MTYNKLDIALICDFHSKVAATIIDHINGIVKYSRHNITIINSIRDLPSNLILDKFDGVIIHYSLIACNSAYMSAAMRTCIRNFCGIKIAFIQDDYRFIDATVTALEYMKIDILFGLVPQRIIDDVYSPSRLPGVRRETVLAGYVPEELLHLNTPPYEQRHIDVGYRARKLPAWLGAFAQDKWIIGERFKQDAYAYGLKCDISSKESSRIYGQAWIDFLRNCKAVLGTESGASICDFTGEIQIAVEAHEARAPLTPFEEYRDLYFKDEDGRFVINVISPRCFEAAALRTLMILYEGEYSERLRAWRHYVPLRKDHANMDEVVAVLRDPEKVREITENAYREVALNQDNWFSAMVLQMDRAIDETFRPSMVKKLPPHTPEEIASILTSAKRRNRIKKFRHVCIVHGVRIFDTSTAFLPERVRLRFRSAMRSSLKFLISMNLKNAIISKILFIKFLLKERDLRSAILASRTIGEYSDVILSICICKYINEIKDVRMAACIDDKERSIVLSLISGISPETNSGYRELSTKDDFLAVTANGSVSSFRFSENNLSWIAESKLHLHKKLSGLLTLSRRNPEISSAFLARLCRE